MSEDIVKHSPVPVGHETMQENSLLQGLIRQLGEEEIEWLKDTPWDTLLSSEEVSVLEMLVKYGLDNSSEADKRAVWRWWEMWQRVKLMAGESHDGENEEESDIISTALKHYYQLEEDWKQRIQQETGERESRSEGLENRLPSQVLSEEGWLKRLEQEWEAFSVEEKRRFLVMLGNNPDTDPIISPYLANLVKGDEDINIKEVIESINQQKAGEEQLGQTDLFALLRVILTERAGSDDLIKPELDRWQDFLDRRLALNEQIYQKFLEWVRDDSEEESVIDTLREIEQQAAEEDDQEESKRKVEKAIQAIRALADDLEEDALRYVCQRWIDRVEIAFFNRFGEQTEGSAEEESVVNRLEGELDQLSPVNQAIAWLKAIQEFTEDQKSGSVDDLIRQLLGEEEMKKQQALVEVRKMMKAVEQVEVIRSLKARVEQVNFGDKQAELEELVEDGVETEESRGLLDKLLSLKNTKSQLLNSIKGPVSELTERPSLLDLWQQVLGFEILTQQWEKQWKALKTRVYQPAESGVSSELGSDKESEAGSEVGDEESESPEDAEEELTENVRQAWALLHMLEASNWNIDAVHNASTYQQLEQRLNILGSSRISLEKKAADDIARRIRLHYTALKIKGDSGGDEGTINMLSALASGYRQRRLLTGEDLKELFTGNEQDKMQIKEAFCRMRQVGLLGLGATDIAELINQSKQEGFPSQVKDLIDSVLEEIELPDNVTSQWVKDTLFTRSEFFADPSAREKAQDRIFYVTDNLKHQALVQAYLEYSLIQAGGDENYDINSIRHSMKLAENLAYVTYEFSKWNRDALFGDNVAEAFNLYNYRMGRFEQDRDRGPDITLDAFESVGMTFLERQGLVKKITDRQRRKLVEKINESDKSLTQILGTEAEEVEQIFGEEELDLWQQAIINDYQARENWEEIGAAALQTYYLPYLTRVLTAKRYILKTDWKPGEITEDLLHALVPVMQAIDETGEGKEAALLFAGIFDEVMRNPRVLGWAGKSIWHLSEIKRMLKESRLFSDEQVDCIYKEILGEEQGLGRYIGWGPFVLANIFTRRFGLRSYRAFWIDFWEAFMRMH